MFTTLYTDLVCCTDESNLISQTDRISHSCIPNHPVSDIKGKDNDQLQTMVCCAASVARHLVRNILCLRDVFVLGWFVRFMPSMQLQPLLTVTDGQPAHLHFSQQQTALKEIT